MNVKRWRTLGTAQALPSESSLLSVQASNGTALSFGSSVKWGAHPLSISSFHSIPGAGAGVKAERLQELAGWRGRAWRWGPQQQPGA